LGEQNISRTVKERTVASKTYFETLQKQKFLPNW